MGLQFQYVQYQATDNVAIITLNRPEALNALNRQMAGELRQAARAAAEDPDVRVVVFTGAGDRAFSAGADIKEFLDISGLEVLEPWLQGLFHEIDQMPKPTIAAVNGYALGGGCELALACDLRIAADNARFGQPEVSVGILAGAGGTQRLASLVGLGRAKELLFTGDIIDAMEAYRIGLVNRVVAAGQALEAAVAMARKIRSRAPLAVRLTKLACQAGQQALLHTGLVVERLASALVFTTEDKNEGAQAFIERREPKFQGK